MQKEITAAGGLVFNDANELLVIYRRGKWDLPKGKLDEGETIEACAVREVEEETGLTQLVLGEKIGVTHHAYVQDGDNILKASHWYRMQAPGAQKLVPQTEEDIEKIQWINATALPELLKNSYSNIVEIVHKSGFLR
ncbi:NUDIX hydrolase [Deminuibacter soli]|uniref:NUDIX hydrolase n=1 Tax=Deminuibacter soli TaxID=2291815 RepID=A0A3E1NJS4_9BACT|nr:NUDIX hydrolase [Deminuibacter soli]RFM28131.1 NUDIX hydrolase [Deminuibacter soli]